MMSTSPILQKILFLTLILLLALPAHAGEYKVLRVIDGDTVYLDFNGNGRADRDERVRLNGIDAFEVRPTSNLKWQMKKYGISLEEALWLGYQGRVFAENELLGKVVSAEFSAEVPKDKYERPLMSLTYGSGKSFEKEILKAGLATVYGLSNRAGRLKKYESLRKIKRNARNADKHRLIYYSYKNKCYYSIKSEEALNPENRLIELDNSIHED